MKITNIYPLSNIAITLHTLVATYHYFSKLDLKSDFLQSPIDEKVNFKTAFITPFSLHECNGLPQGLCNASPIFQRVMYNILSSCTEFSSVFLEVQVIFRRTYDEHLIHLKKILNALQLRYLILTSTKCEIAEQQLNI
ncbi:unnamed protein product [Rotaria sp. Silwood2]|nr:unnamed protein product [Rotaria sp. Silwood2]CAF4321282.1 unnamed protein product [Rotaria sp. Silwood2]